MRKHTPPWGRQHRWEHRPPWAHKHSHLPLPGEFHKRRKLFWRFFGFLFFMAIPLMAVGAIFGFYLKSSGVIETPKSLIGFALCGIPLLFPLLAAALRARRMVNPLAGVMAAADALAEGNFSVRVSESGDEEFSKLASSFNHMAEELERSEYQRRNLTADVAHELRTPLHIIQGNIEGLRDGIYQASPEHIETILDEIHLLTHLVDDLQTLSRAEAGELSLEIGSVNVTELLNDVSASFSGQAQSLGMDLRVELQEDAQDLTIAGDWHRLDQVLGNLVANALRYTPVGGSVSLEAGPALEGVFISVSDTGAGIPAEDLPYVFDRFWKGDRARSRSGNAGSGLGLAIARQLVRAHGGKINVESKIGEGTTFTIVLPFSSSTSLSS